MTTSKRRSSTQRKEFPYLIMDKEQWLELNGELHLDKQREAYLKGGRGNQKYADKALYVCNTNRFNKKTVECSGNSKNAEIKIQPFFDFGGTFISNVKLTNTRKDIVLYNINGLPEYDENGKYTEKEFNEYAQNLRDLYTTLFNEVGIEYISTRDYVLVDMLEVEFAYHFLAAITSGI